MGTSGAMVFVIDGERKAGYTHFDGYPDGGLGSDLLAWPFAHLPTKEEFIDQVTEDEDE